MKKLISLFIILSICFSDLNAQSGEAPVSRKAPSLNGHRFPSTRHLRSPFVVTSLETNVGFGETSTLKLDGITIGDYVIGGFSGKIQYLDLDMQYQQRFTPWLSMFFSLTMAARLGTDMPTILADGVNKLAGGNIGWLFRILETDKFYLSGHFMVSNIGGDFINVNEFIRDLINNEPDPAVYKKVPAMTVGTGFRGAYAFNPSYGLQFNLDYAYGESLERGDTESYFYGGILGSIDFNPKREVPIGLALGYSLSSSPEIVMDNGGTSNLFIGKIIYTGSGDFELGLQFTYYNVYLRNISDKPFVNNAMLTFKFFF